jgi:hypothetical protein
MGKAPRKSLKDRNRPQLWAIMAANAIAFYCVAQWDAISASGTESMFKHATNLLPVGLTIILTTVANALIGSDNKARLVFLRWKHALPRHRAFSSRRVLARTGASRTQSGNDVRTTSPRLRGELGLNFGYSRPLFACVHRTWEAAGRDLPPAPQARAVRKILSRCQWRDWSNRFRCQLRPGATSRILPGPIIAAGFARPPSALVNGLRLAESELRW